MTIHYEVRKAYTNGEDLLVTTTLREDRARKLLIMLNLVPYDQNGKTFRAYVRELQVTQSEMNS